MRRASFAAVEGMDFTPGIGDDVETMARCVSTARADV
jgi:hypothetical protein